MAGGLSAPALSQGAAARTLRFVPQANLANFDPIWGTQYVVRNASDAGLGHALRRRRQASAAAPDGGGRGGLRRRPDLDLPAARGPAVPRRRAGAGAGRASPRSTRWMRARPDGPDAPRDPERARRGRRPHLHAGGCASPTRRCCWRSARTTRRCAFIMPERIAKHRPLPADHRVCRLRPDALRAQRMGAGRARGVREVRPVRAAQRAGRAGSPAASA